VVEDLSLKREIILGAKTHDHSTTGGVNLGVHELDHLSLMNGLSWRAVLFRALNRQQAMHIVA